MSSVPLRTSSVKIADDLCRKLVTDDKIQQLRNRPEKNASEICNENHAVSEELKKQISELTHIRKSETVDSRLKKIETAIDTLRGQTKPLKKALNSTLYSTDTELLELVAQTTRETLIEIGGVTAIDPVEVGKKVKTAIQRMKKSVEEYDDGRKTWCQGWIVTENMQSNSGTCDEPYGDEDISERHRFADHFGIFHRFTPELLFVSNYIDDAKRDASCLHAKEFRQPAVYPFNVECDFLFQLIDLECSQKEKKPREKIERGSKKKQAAELVKVNDKAKSVQSEEVSISNELKHVLKILRKELKSRNSDTINYYEFVTNPTSFSRTVENMFYVSYLMRDREVYLQEESGVPVLKRPTTVNEQEKKQWDQNNSTHGLTSLSFEQWKLLSSKYLSSIITPLD